MPPCRPTRRNSRISTSSHHLSQTGKRPNGPLRRDVWPFHRPVPAGEDQKVKPCRRPPRG